MNRSDPCTFSKSADSGVPNYDTLDAWNTGFMLLQSRRTRLRGEMKGSQHRERVLRARNEGNK